MPDSRKGSGQFKKGVSGNPGGKSADREALRIHIKNYLAEQCEEHIKGIEVLARDAASEKVQLAARVWLAEQFIGKPTQAISGPDGGPVQTVDLSKLSLEQLEQLEQLHKAASGEGK